MKKVSLILLFLLFINLITFSQNWRLLSVNDSYNYSIDSVDYISHTIKIDSFEAIGNDTVFYLNRIMTNCDTCANNQYNDFALRNQPQFLMRKMIKVSDSLYIFQDTSEFRIMPFKKFGESWIFDEENNITAAVSYVTEIDIFGITDSMKNISLSNGNKIKFSKNFGIIEFPADDNNSYELVGIEGGREIGESLPNFWDFFDWEVGDIFQRMQYFEEFWGGTSINYYVKKYEILSKEIIDETITYDISGWVKYIHIWEDYNAFSYYDTSSYRFEETIFYIDSLNHFTNRCPDELIDIRENFEEFYHEETMLNKAEIYKGNDRYIRKSGDYESLNYPYYMEESIGSDLLVRAYGSVQGIEIKFTEGLGLEYQIMDFESAWSDIFHGKIHNGDTIGTVYPNSHFQQYSGIDKVNSNNLKIYPNPAKDKFFIDCGNYTVRKISILDITGKYLFEKNVMQQVESGLHTLDLSDLKKGIYIVSVQTDSEIMTSKIIKN